MAVSTHPKKRYFKKEKKNLQPKRHKAKSAKQLEALGKTGLRRGVAVDETQKAEKGSKKLSEFHFPKISRLITEGLHRVCGRLKKVRDKRITWPVELRVTFFGNSFRKSVRHAKKKNFWMSMVLVVSVVFTCFLGWKLWDMYQKWQSMQAGYAKVQHELATWEQVTKAYPTYRDAYFEAAVLAYRLGKKEKEEEYLQKALIIDPNFQPALELKKLTEKSTE